MYTIRNETNFIEKFYTCIIHFLENIVPQTTVLNTKRVEYVFQSLDIFSVMVHAIETQDTPT